VPAAGSFSRHPFKNQVRIAANGQMARYMKEQIAPFFRSLINLFIDIWKRYKG
jgi:hypothetical protein